jgi:starch phosphorylase
MWRPIWPDQPADALPVDFITNGVHVPSWVASSLAALFDKHLSPAWRDQYEDETVWRRILNIPDEDIWNVREALRAYLIQFVRERARQRWIEDQAAPNRVIAAGVMLDSAPLTIGFARRFTGYKRPDLVFRDPDRLARLMTVPGRPVQFVFAGKAHPADDHGKHHLQNVFRHAVDPRFKGRIAVVDDYDLHVAHYLVQGCDVWLNTPRKPMEASGTSGMKASMNGALHLSIGDGWWAEGFTGGNGWQIAGETSDPASVDAADADALYALLEREVGPAFYERDAQGIPRRWVAMIKQAILTITPRFSARRMLKDYVDRAYAPAIARATSRPEVGRSI